MNTASDRNRRDNFIRTLQSLLGEEVVIGDSRLTEPYQASTNNFKTSAIGIALPSSVEEVQEITKLANSEGIALYPISGGRNWGYGSANAACDHNLILDMSRMNRILEVDEDLAYAVVEPGVTQGQLSRYLRENDINLWIDPTGAGPQGSILGNALERGYGIGSYNDHFASMCGMEVVLASGEVLNTGFGHFSNSRAKNLYKYGLGPYLEGIFTQSNFGIVTKIGVWLQAVPEKVELCFFASQKEEGIFSLTEAIRPLLRQQVFQSSLNILNRNRVLTTRIQCPKRPTKREPLLLEDSVREGRNLEIAAWNGVAAFYGNSKQIKANKAIVKSALRSKSDRLVFLNETKFELLSLLQRPIEILSRKNLSPVLQALASSFSIFSGTPDPISLGTPYWRNKRGSRISETTNPAEDDCGLYWLTPIIPMVAKDVQQYIELVEPILNNFGFESCLTFSALSSRIFDSSIPILFDKEDEEERLRAKECYQVLLASCINSGFVPYRLGLQSMDIASDPDNVYWSTVARIKQALDPNNIISPGRYCRKIL